MCAAAKNCKKKFTKAFYFEGSRSFKVINVEPLKACHQLLLREATSLCLSASARRANSEKITTFYGGIPFWRPRAPCGGLLEPRKSGLELLKSTFNAKNSDAGCLGLAQAISVHFTLKMCVAAQNRKKSLKPPIWGFKVVQGRWSWCQSKGRILLVTNSKICPISHRFWDTAIYWLKMANFCTPSH